MSSTRIRRPAMRGFPPQTPGVTSMCSEITGTSFVSSLCVADGSMRSSLPLSTVLVIGVEAGLAEVFDCFQLKNKKPTGKHPRPPLLVRSRKAVSEPPDDLVKQ